MADPEKAPLLQSGTASAMGTPVAAAKEPRQFKGPWYHVLGDCGAADVSATCLAWNAPWVAYGWNTQRGLGLTWWKEALKLTLLTCGVFALVRLLLVVLVETQCPDLPHAMHGMHHDHHHGHWHHMMHHPGHGGPHHGHPADPAAVATANAAVAAVAAASTASTTATAGATVADVATQTTTAAAQVAEQDKEEEDERNERHGPHHLREQDDDDEDGDDHDDDDDDFDLSELTPEQHEALHHCALRVGPWAVVLVSVGVTALIYAAYLAALRRRMMRERFGIEGSFRHDLLLWLGCAPCALAQETRTLMFNNVEEGLWHGPLQVLTAPRQAQPMAA